MNIDEMISSMNQPNGGMSKDDITKITRDVLDSYFYATKEKNKSMIDQSTAMITELDSLIEMSKELTYKEKTKYKEIIQDTVDGNKTTKRVIDKAANGSMAVVKSLLPTTDFLIGSIVQQSPILAMGMSATKNVIDNVKRMRADRDLEHAERMSLLDVEKKNEVAGNADQPFETETLQKVNFGIEKQSDILVNHTGLLERISDGVEAQGDITKASLEKEKTTGLLERMKKDEAARESITAQSTEDEVVDSVKGGLFDKISGMMSLITSGGLIAVLSSMAAAVGTFIIAASPIVVGLLAMSAITYKFYEGWQKATDRFGESATLTDKIASGLGTMAGLMGNIADTIINFLGTPFGLPEVDLGSMMSEFFSNMYKNVFDFLKAPQEHISAMIDWSKTQYKDAVNSIRSMDITGMLKDSIIKPVLSIFSVVVESLSKVRNHIIEGIAERIEEFGFKGTANKVRKLKVDIPKRDENYGRTVPNFIPSSELPNDFNKTTNNSEVGVQQSFGVKKVMPKYSPPNRAERTKPAPQTEQDGVSTSKEKLSDLFTFYGISERDLMGIDPVMLSNLKNMAREYKEKFGEKIQLNSAFRSFEEQAKLKKKHGSQAAAPGSSMHNYGLAVDMNTSNANKADGAGLFSKYGFKRPVSGETWHVEPSNIDRKKVVASGRRHRSSGGISSGGSNRTETEGSVSNLSTVSNRTKLDNEITGKTMEATQTNKDETAKSNVMMDNRVSTNNVSNNIIAPPTNFNTVQPDFGVLFKTPIFGM